MAMSHLNGHHRKTLASLFRHPASHNVEWHDLLSLLKHIGTVSERHSGDVDVAIDGHAIITERPKDHDFEGDQLRSLRHFMAVAGLSPDGDAASMPPMAQAGADAGMCIVVIDHHHVKIFAACRDDQATGEPIVLSSDDDDGSRRRVTRRQGDDDHDGGHASDDAAYYERISGYLIRAARIVVLSDGKGRSNAGDHLVAYLKRHHSEIAQRIFATDRVDISQLSDGEIVETGLALVPA